MADQRSTGASADGRHYENLAQAIQRVGALPPGASQHSMLADVYGVLVDCSLPRPTKGPDVVVNLRLIDPSTEDQALMADGVEALVFCPKPERMPQSRAPGDIIRLHKVQVQSFNGKPQLLGRLNGGPDDVRRFTPLSFCLFDGKINGSNVPYSSSTSNPSFDPVVDGQKLAQLRLFAQQTGITTATWQETTTFLRKVADIRPAAEEHMSMGCVDIFCQILAVDARDPHETVLFVWDSTDARPLPSNMDVAAPLWHGHAFTGSRVKRPMPLAAAPPAIKVAPDLPDLGTAVPVLLPAGLVACNRTDVLTVGSWVKFRVVGPQIVQGQLQLVCGSSSRVTPATVHQQTADEYAARAARHNTATWARTERSAIVTRCLRQELPLVSIRQVLKQRRSGTSATFRLLGRIISHTPSCIEDLCRPVPPQSTSCRQGQWTFACNLLLADATGELDVLVLAEEAEQLFGMGATNMRQSPQQLEALRMVLRHMMEQDVNGGSWLDLAISSMYKAGAESPIKECKYVLHDTVPAGAHID